MSQTGQKKLEDKIRREAFGTKKYSSFKELKRDILKQLETQHSQVHANLSKRSHG